MNNKVFHYKLLTCLRSLLLIITVCYCNTLIAQEFQGRVVTEWLVDQEKSDRDMELIEEFTFIDSKGNSWLVPEGAKVDGASIPRIFWTTTGPPFVGNYRRATVVHDHFCNTKSKPWREVHRMFYDAMLTDGVSILKAKKMYAAVYSAGPRWKDTGLRNAQGMKVMTGYKPDPDFEKVNRIIESENLENMNLEDLEKELDSYIYSSE